MANRYWVNDDADGDFSGANNWAAASGGAGGVSVPGTGDVAILDGACVDNCSLSASVTLGGITTLAGYTGTFFALTYDVTGDDGANFTFDGTRLELGSGTWSLTNGTYDAADTGVVYGTSTFEFFGSCTVVGNFGGSSKFSNITVGAGVTLTITGGNVYAFGTVDIAGTLHLTAAGGESIWSDFGFSIEANGDLIVRSSGLISSTGTPRLVLVRTTNGHGFLSLASTGSVTAGITIYATLYGVLPAGTYSGVYVISTQASDTHLSLSGTYVIDTFYSFGSSINAAGTISLTVLAFTSQSGYFWPRACRIDNSGQAATWSITGDVITGVAAYGLTWTAGTSDPEIIATGTLDQDWDWDGHSIGKVEIDKSAGTLTLSSAMSCDSLTGTDGSLDMGGQTLTTANDVAFASGFTFGIAGSIDGCTMSIGGNLTFDGQIISASATWTLTVTGTAVASGVGQVEYSDASGGTEIDASGGPWVDDGNNLNWSFVATSTGHRFPWQRRRQRRLAGAR